MSYPNLLRRYLASLIDLVTVFCILYLYSRTSLYTPDNNTGGLALFVVLALYEPLMTVYACTLGQAAMRFRVRRVEDLKSVSLRRAYLRIVFKYLLGIFSFLTVPARRDRRAIHDLAAETIVVEAKGAK